MLKLRWLALAVLVCAACRLDGLAIDGRRYACETIAPCGAGFTCEGGVCVAAGQGDGGCADGGSCTTGADDGGLLSGLVAWYRFSEGSGLQALDSSGNAHNGLVRNGAVWTMGHDGGGLVFDGVDDYVDLGNSFGMSGSMTVSAWISSNGNPPAADDAVIISSLHQPQFGPGFQLDTTVDLGSRALGFKLTTSAGAKMARYGRTTLNTGQWHHVVGVFDATAQSLSVYLDGSPDDGALVGVVDSSQLDGDGGLCIGKRPQTNNQYEFNGLIDEVMVFSRPLSASEVTALYLAPP